MRPFIAVTTIGLALLGFAACNSKVEASREAEELEKKAGIAHQDADAAKASAEAEKKAAEMIRISGDMPAKDFEQKVREPDGQK